MPNKYIKRLQYDLKEFYKVNRFGKAMFVNDIKLIKSLDKSCKKYQKNLNDDHLKEIDNILLTIKNVLDFKPPVIEFILEIVNINNLSIIQKRLQHII